MTRDFFFEARLLEKRIGINVKCKDINWKPQKIFPTHGEFAVAINVEIVAS